MKLYKIHVITESELIVAAENIAEAMNGVGLVGECTNPHVASHIKSVASYDGPSSLREYVEIDA